MSAFDSASEFSISEMVEVDRSAYYQELEEIGPYELTRLIGSGGMSRVFHGRHRRTGQEVAVKVLRPEMLQRKHVVHRFRSEFRIARKLSHPNIIRALDFGIEQGLAYLVLEYVAGQSLFELIRAHVKLPEDEAVRIIRQTAEGLQVAHQNNLIHRDIKPANVMVTPDGEAKVADLGLAKDLLAEESITRSNASLGTLHYMAPEQFMNARKADARADIYSLGVTLYHVLTGKLPFSGGQMTMLQRKMANQFVPPRDIVTTLSPGMNQLILKAMRANPDERHLTCGEFLSHLETAGSRSPSTVLSINLPPAGAAKQGDNRRAEDRFQTSLQSHCTMLMNPNKETWQGEVVDVSHGGALIQVPRRFEIGSLLSVDVDDDKLEEPITFMIRVSWVRPGSEAGTWRVGGKFSRRMPPSELQRILNRELATVMLQQS